MGIFGLVLIPLIGSKNINRLIFYIYSIISAECGYRVFVTRICNGGRISYLLNFISKLKCTEQKTLTFHLMLLKKELQTT